MTTSDKGYSTAPVSQQQDKALVRVVDAIPGPAAVDTYAGDAKLFPAIFYKSITPYREIEEDRQVFRVTSAGEAATSPLAENSESLSGAKHYTLIAMPANSKGETVLRVFNDELVQPSPGKARVRVIHAAEGAGEVDIFNQTNNQLLFSKVIFDTETSYREVNPLSTCFEIHSAENGRAQLTIPVHFEADRTYTIVLLGEGAKLDTLTVEDHLGQPQAALL